MATYDPGAIRAAIKTILLSISSLQGVYDYLNPTITNGYPVAIFDIDNETAEMLDDVNNTRTLTFKIWVACEIPVNGIAAASAALDLVTKDTINALEKLSNANLGGACDWTLPVMGSRQRTSSPEGDFFYQELQLKVNVVSYINS